jgi:hypothetical protein
MIVPAIFIIRRSLQEEFLARKRHPVSVKSWPPSPRTGRSWPA